MHCNKYAINFDLDQLMDEELPWTQAFYREEPAPGQVKGNFYQDVREYFEFPMKNQQEMPVYELHLSSCAAIETTFERSYAMLVEAVGKLFNEPQAKIMEYMGCDFLRKYPWFIDYAKWTYREHNASARQSIYGRFDAALDPDSEVVTGIYEFNGDTPTMLFESVAVQNLVCEQITGDVELQLNSLWPNMQELFRQLGQIPGTAAVVFDGGTFEDMATCEVIAQIMGEENLCLFVDGTDMQYDRANPEQPWVVVDRDDHLSVIFALIPWEEMITTFPEGYQDWQRWAPNVTFLEPAWRWFISNKGIWAYVTHLLQNDQDFVSKYGQLPVLPTFLKPDELLAQKLAYVKKPKIGRMSNNIEIYNEDGSHHFSTDGAYAGDDCVYQVAHAPYQVNGRHNFIVGMFMTPDHATNYHTIKEATASTLCIREFDSPVLGIKNERFVPHILIDDVNEEEDYE